MKYKCSYCEKRFDDAIDAPISFEYDGIGHNYCTKCSKGLGIDKCQSLSDFEALVYENLLNEGDFIADKQLLSRQTGKKYSRYPQEDDVPAGIPKAKLDESYWSKRLRRKPGDPEITMGGSHGFDSIEAFINSAKSLGFNKVADFEKWYNYHKLPGETPVDTANRWKLEHGDGYAGESIDRAPSSSNEVFYDTTYGSFALSKVDKTGIYSNDGTLFDFTIGDEITKNYKNEQYTGKISQFHIYPTGEVYALGKLSNENHAPKQSEIFIGVIPQEELEALMNFGKSTETPAKESMQHPLTPAATLFLAKHPELTERISVFEKEFYPADTTENNAALNFAQCLANDFIVLERDLEKDIEYEGAPYYDTFYGTAYSADFDCKIVGFRYELDDNNKLCYVIELDYEADVPMGSPSTEEHDFRVIISTNYYLILPNDPLNQDGYDAYEVEVEQTIDY